MNPRSTAILLLVAAGLAAFVYFYELGGEEARLDAEQREKRLFRDVEPEDVAWIELRTSDGVDARLEQSEGDWRLTRPIAFPADAVAGRIADALASLAHEARIETPQPDAEYGLDDASARVLRFGTADAEHELRLGAKTPVGDGRYARRGDASEVFTVAGFQAGSFEQTLEALREKRVLDFDTTSVRRLEARWPGGRVLLERAPPPSAGEDAPEAPAADAAGWHMTSPLEVPADARAVDRLLSTLSFLRADAFDDAPSDARRALLDPPDFAVTLHTGEADAAPLELAISRADADGQRWVRAAAGDVLYRVRAERIDDFPRRTVAYRDRRLASYAPLDAQQIDFFFQSAEGDPVVIHGERRDDGWSAEPEDFQPGRLSAAVTELSRLAADDIVAESMGPDELEALGLSPPATVITVLGKPPETGGDDARRVLAELHLGRVTPAGVVVRAAGRPEIWRLGLDAAAQLPLSLDVFRERFRDAGSVGGAPAPPEPDPELPDPAGESP